MELFARIKPNIDIIVILSIAFLMRIIGLDRMSLWLDEVYTAVESNPNYTWSELMNSIFTSDPHPPLYFILVYLAFKIFGYTAIVLRFISVLMGVAGVWATFRLGKELYDRNAGLYAAILAAANYFCLYYSQEGRMYAMLYLTTTMAFYYLVRFIKEPVNKNFLLYLLWSVLMIYSHLVGVFVLVSQYLILAYFVLRPFRITAKKMLLYIFGAGISTIVLYIPVIGIILKNRDRKSIWIQMPTSDVFTQYFKDFFGSAEVVVMFALFLIFVFWFQVTRKGERKKTYINPEVDRLLFSAFLLVIWIFATLLQPLVRSYTDLPIMVNRYFICIVPALLIMISIGLTFIRSKMVQIAILSIVLIFSFFDLIIVKQFYRAHYKSQFREVSQFIIDNNKNNEPVITRLGFYFPFYLKNHENDYTIIDKPLDVHVNEIMQDSTSLKPFWYADAHGNPFKLDEKQEAFLNRKFSLENNYDGYDAWVRHYVPGSGGNLVDLSEFGELKQNNGNPIRYNFDKFEVNDSGAELFGWAFLDGQPATDSKVHVVLVKDGKAIKIVTSSFPRPDVTSSNQHVFNLDNSGFMAKIDQSVPRGDYEVGIFIENKISKKTGLVLTGRKFEKK